MPAALDLMSPSVIWYSGLSHPSSAAVKGCRRNAALCRPRDIFSANAAANAFGPRSSNNRLAVRALREISIVTFNSERPMRYDTDLGVAAAAATSVRLQRRAPSLERLRGPSPQTRAQYGTATFVAMTAGTTTFAHERVASERTSTERI